MANHACRIVFQPIIELSSERIVAYEALARPRDGTPPLVWFERAWSAGYGAEREGMSMLRTIELARRLPEGTALSLNASAELILADPEWLACALFGLGRPVWLELDPLEAIRLHALERDHGALASLRASGAIDLVVEGACAPSALALLRPSIVKISSEQPDPSLLAAARAAGARLCRANLGSDEPVPPAESGYELAQGWRYGRPDELQHWIDRRASRGLAA